MLPTYHLVCIQTAHISPQHLSAQTVYCKLSPMHYTDISLLVQELHWHLQLTLRLHGCSYQLQWRELVRRGNEQANKGYWYCQHTLTHYSYIIIERGTRAALRTIS